MMISYERFRYLVAGKKNIIWLVNVGAEKYWHDLPNTLNGDSDNFISQIEGINIALAKEDDYIIVSELPDDEYLRYLEENGFNIPMFLQTYRYNGKSLSESVLSDNKLIDFLKSKKDDYVFVPYAVTLYEEQIASATGLKMVGGWHNASKLINDKVFARKLAQKLDFLTTDGAILNDEREALKYYNNFLCERKCVLKSSHGASGKGLLIFHNENQLKIIIKTIDAFRTGDDFILERWYDEKTDFNYQFIITDTGKVVAFSIKEQIMSGVKYIGSVIPARISKELVEKICAYATIIGQALFEFGYSGIANVDAIYTGNGFIPIIEINGRFSLSTYISFVCEKFSVKHAIVKYYDIYMLSSVLLFKEFEQKLNFLKSKDGKMIILNYCVNKEKNSNGKHKCRFFLLYLGDSLESLNELVKETEKYLKMNYNWR